MKYISIYIYNITDGQTQQLFTIFNHYYHGNLYRKQKSHENAEITIYCTGKVQYMVIWSIYGHR